MTSIAVNAWGLLSIGAGKGVKKTTRLRKEAEQTVSHFKWQEIIFDSFLLPVPFHVASQCLLFGVWL